MILDTNMKREIILDNYQYPSHKGLKGGAGYQKAHMASDSCIDDITVEAKIEGDKIIDINFDGVACSLSTASTSIMCQMLIGKSVEDARYFIEQYNNMIFEKEYDSDILEELNAFDQLHKQANRIKCGTIGFRGLTQILDEREK